MGLLIDKVPYTVEIEGKEYCINTDFRICIMFEQLLQDDAIGDDDKGALILRLFYPELPVNIEEAFKKVIWIYNGIEEVGNSSKSSGGKSKKLYDFDYDGDYIFAAFLEQYNIDLQDVKYLHWWKFKALFKALKEDTEIVKIIGYRGMNVNEIKDKKERDKYKKLQRFYKLPVKKEKGNSELEEALMRGEIV